MKKILIPVDGSEASKHAVQKVIDTVMPAHAGLEIALLYVDMPLQGFVAGHPVVTHETSDTSSVEALMDTYRAMFANTGSVIETIYKQGHIVDTIIDVAEHGDYDLLVMGSTGLNHPLERFFLGSVTDGVLKKSHIATLVVH